MRILCWNVNSTRKRLSLLAQVSRDHDPHVMLLQELKCGNEHFPTEVINQMGYEALVCGQKQYNGVALLYKKSLSKPQQVRTSLPGYHLQEARYQEGIVKGIRISNMYVPNGSDMTLQQYQDKLVFIDCLAHLSKKELLKEQRPWIMGGDFNVIARTIDSHDRSPAWEKSGLGSPAIRKKWRSFLNQGWADVAEKEGLMTYQSHRSPPETRLRLDRILLSPIAADALVRCEVLSEVRGAPETSDHMPVLLEIEENLSLPS